MLITILGNIGSGKTLLLAYLSSLSKRLVYSNFNIKIPNYRELKVINLLDLEQNINVFIDEGYTWLESRTSNSTLNRYISYIVFQSRKRTIDIYITAQLFSSVDLRFREQSNIIINCNRKEKDFHYNFHYGNTVKTFILPYKKAKKYFKLYDTYEIVEPNQKQELEFKIIQQNPVHLLLKVKEIAKLIDDDLEIYTHDSIKSILFLKGINIAYEKYLYLYFKGLIKIDNN